MQKSESIANLALALSKFQSEITDTEKDSQGYGYNYSSLSTVLEKVRPLCAKYELAVIQLCVSDPANASVAGIETVLTHSSGEWVSSTMYMPVEDKKGLSLAQCAGVVLTYCRRYSLAAVLGITQVDTDGANGVERKEAAKPKVYKLEE